MLTLWGHNFFIKYNMALKVTEGHFYSQNRKMHVNKFRIIIFDKKYYLFSGIL